MPPKTPPDINLETLEAIEVRKPKRGLWKRLKDLNFKVSIEFHHVFKMRAAAWGLSMTALLVLCFASFAELYGEHPPPGWRPGDKPQKKDGRRA